MNKTPSYILFIFSILVVASCDYFESENTQTAVAKVGNKYLFEEDLPKFSSDLSTKEDSLAAVKRYLNEWALTQIMLEKAKFNLPKEQQAKYDEMAKEYRQQLYINAYKDALIEKNYELNYDTAKIEAYYKTKKENFKLKETLLQIRYLAFQSDLKDKNVIKTKFESFTTKDQEFLEDKRLEFKNFNLNDSVWVRLVDIQKKLPSIKSSLADLANISTKQKIEIFTDSLHTYMLFIKDIKKQNQVPPMSYLAPTIQQILENKKKLELNKQIEKDIINDAIQNNEYKIY